jgi:hypothetical protein
LLSARARQNDGPSSSTDSCGHPCRPSGFSATQADGLNPSGEVPEYVNNRSLQGYLLVLKKKKDAWCLAQAVVLFLATYLISSVAIRAFL